MEPTTLRFATAARTLAATCRRLGLVAPGFRSPPRLDEVDRSLRRRGDQTVVSVRLRERLWPAVAADMIEGVVVANELSETAAARAREAMWSALATASLAGVAGAEDAAPTGTTPTGTGSDSSGQRGSARALRVARRDAA